MTLIQELRWRGMIQDIMPGTEELFEKEQVSGYIGFDPTSDSLHIGSLVPILLLANLFFGIYMNLSIWFKLGDKTYYGFYFTLLGAIITIGLNVYLIPIYGFVASAYTTLACYFIMMLACYFVGQKHYPVPYEIRKAFFYFVLMLAFYFFARSLESFIGKGNLLFLQLAQTGIFILYIAIAFIEDFKNKKFA